MLLLCALDDGGGVFLAGSVGVVLYAWVGLAFDVWYRCCVGISGLGFGGLARYAFCGLGVICCWWVRCYGVDYGEFNCILRLSSVVVWFCDRLLWRLIVCVGWPGGLLTLSLD